MYPVSRMSCWILIPYCCNKFFNHPIQLSQPVDPTSITKTGRLKGHAAHLIQPYAIAEFVVLRAVTHIINDCVVIESLLVIDQYRSIMN